MSGRWGMLADDLTGAMDAGMQLPGRPAIWFEMERPVEGWNIVSTESRNLPHEQAAARVRRALDAFRRLGVAMGYKKIDSTLRGPVGAELEAVLSAGACRAVALAPALPESGRVTRNGIQLVDGIEVTQTEFGSDPFAAPGSSRICELLPRGMAFAEIGRMEGQALLRAMRKALADGKRILILDAGEEEDLARIAWACAQMEGVLPCGSAGLIQKLVPAQSAREIRRLDGPMLVLSGTPAAQTKEAIRFAARSGGALFLRAGPDGLDRAVRALGQGRPVVADFAAGSREEIAGFSEEERARRRLEVLGMVERWAKACLGPPGPGALTVFGGDTLRAVCRALGAEGLRIEGMVEKLVPAARLVGGAADGMQLVCKAGGFGRRETLKEILERSGADMAGEKPVLAITMGDPAGVGPEIIVKALMDARVHQICRPLVVGSAQIMRQAVRMVQAPGLHVRAIQSPQQAAYAPDTLNVLDLWGLEAEAVAPGRVSAVSGEAAVQAVRAAIDLAMGGQAGATVTAPINKEAIRLSGCPYAGHTELYAAQTGSSRFSMMLAHGGLRVVHVSTHVSLREACERVKSGRVLEVIRLAWEACRALGISRPRVAVAGLNPHAGENGLFGREEIEEICPALEAARQQGIQAEGPLPPDTVFARAAGGLYDIVVAMYHDQGHIAVKQAGFRFDGASGACQGAAGVNVTLGLPIIRTSVDHGTAFDIAWKNQAAADSMIEAIEYAVRMTQSKP